MAEQGGDAPESVTISSAELARLHSAAKSFEQSEKDTAATLIDKDLALALAGAPLVQGAAGHVSKLLRDEFTAKRVDGKWEVLGKDGRPLAEVVRDRLGSPDFACFRKPASNGGGGGGNTPPDRRPDRPSYLEMVAANIEHQRTTFRGRGLPTRK